MDELKKEYFKLCAAIGNEFLNIKMKQRHIDQLVKQATQVDMQLAILKAQPQPEDPSEQSSSK